MLIKAADDKSKRLSLLASLQGSPVLEDDKKRWLDKELWAIKEGMRGERDAAHYLDNHFETDNNLAVIHDLRLEVDGEVAQIDHLLISRGFVFYLLETKQYNGDLHINEFGEFAVAYGKGRPWGIPSPLEQSRRHQNVLVKLLDRLGISGRTQKQPEFRHVVLVNPKVQIHRPPKEVFDSSNVIKADQFASWRAKHVHGEVSVLKTFSLLMNMRAADTVREWAEMLSKSHKPQDLLALPEFMQPRLKADTLVQSPLVIAETVAQKAAESEPLYITGLRAVCVSCAKPLLPAEQEFCTAKAEIFAGQMLCIAHQKEYRQAKKATKTVDMPKVKIPGGATAKSEQEDPRKRKLVCCTCDSRISFDEGKFCWNNERRFVGLQYCRTHQADFR